MSLTNRDLWIDPAETDKEGTQLFGHLLVLTLVTILVVSLLWADFAVLDEITRGEGKVIPSSQVQKIQSEKGGVLQEMKVHESDIVEAGQVLVILDNTQVKTNREELQQRVWTGTAAERRLLVEISGGTVDNIKFPDDLLANVPEVAEAERQNFIVRQLQLESQKATLEQQVETKQQEISQIDTRVSSARKSLNIASERVEILRPMVKQKVASIVDLLEAQQQMQDYQSEISNAEASRAPAKAALAEARSKLKEITATFRAEASSELGRVRGDLRSAEALLRGTETESGRQSLTSPVRGTVKEIFINTPGGVIQPGEDIIDIVPIEDSLLIEAQIRPQDRGFIAPDQPAQVKITAYDYSIYGGLEAKVEQISADAIENEKKELFFRVRLRTANNYLIGKDGGQLPIIPGMTATVDILTGKKTVLNYLLKPILRARDTALTER